jgi:AAA15 family ATPase/GTPase
MLTLLGTSKIEIVCCANGAGKFSLIDSMFSKELLQVGCIELVSRLSLD